MRTPPLLMGTLLAVWGWHSGLWWAGLPLALLAELPRWIGWRWELGAARAPPGGRSVLPAARLGWSLRLSEPAAPGRGYTRSGEMVAGSVVSAAGRTTLRRKARGGAIGAVPQPAPPAGRRRPADGFAPGVYGALSAGVRHDAARLLRLFLLLPVSGPVGCLGALAAAGPTVGGRCCGVRC